jgi:leucyl-tRNA synthetase
VNEAAVFAAAAPAIRPDTFSEQAIVLRKASHGALARVSEDIEKLRFNRCVAHIYEFTNVLQAVLAEAGATPAPALELAPDLAPDLAWAVHEAAEILVQLFHPMMPHLAEECWAALGHRTLLAEQGWPVVERELLIESTITLPVQVNGKKRADVTVARDAGNLDIEAAVLALDAVRRALDGKAPKKVIVVPQRIVNVVA